VQRTPAARQSLRRLLTALRRDSGDSDTTGVIKEINTLILSTYTDRIDLKALTTLMYKYAHALSESFSNQPKGKRRCVHQ
jgi:hypothetical protein